MFVLVLLISIQEEVKSLMEASTVTTWKEVAKSMLLIIIIQNRDRDNAIPALDSNK